MAFSFLHTSDWHIAKPFTRFKEEWAGQLRAARLGVIERLAALARAEGVRHVLVAGDIYDHPQLPNKALFAPLERMKSAADVTWHVIPGNHDPGEPGGVWERVTRSGLPPNVNLYLEARPFVIGEHVVLLPSPILSKQLGRDPTAWMGGVASGADQIRIGLAHGPVATFGSGGYEQASIDPGRAEAAGLSYLALGDWHGAKQITERTWYSGTPEPEQFPDNEPGFALLVRVNSPGSAAVVERRATAKYNWLGRTLTIRSASDLEPFVAEIDALGIRAHDTLVELLLEGEIGLGEEAMIGACVERLEPRLFHMACNSDGLRLAAVSGAVEAIEDIGLREVAARLASLAASGTAREQAVAERALRRLFGFAGHVERGG